MGKWGLGVGGWGLGVGGWGGRGRGGTLMVVRRGLEPVASSSESFIAVRVPGESGGVDAWSLLSHVFLGGKSGWDVTSV